MHSFRNQISVSCELTWNREDVLRDHACRNPAVPSTFLQDKVGGPSAKIGQLSQLVDTPLLSQQALNTTEIRLRHSSELFAGTFWDHASFLAETGEQFNHGHHFINAKVGDRKVQQKLATWNFAVAVASPSCQPWSSASNQHGLSADLGFNFCELNNFLCAMQPCLLALENVKGLLNHPHFGLLVKILEHNGLRLVYQEIQTMAPDGVNTTLLHIQTCCRNFPFLGIHRPRIFTAIWTRT